MRLKVEDTCRLCGNEERGLIFIFGEEGHRLHLRLRIQMTLNIEISVCDPLPKHVCAYCLGQVYHFWEFYEQCRRTQHNLRNLFLKSVPSVSVTTRDHATEYSDGKNISSLPADGLIDEHGEVACQITSNNETVSPITNYKSESNIESNNTVPSRESFPNEAIKQTEITKHATQLPICSDNSFTSFGNASKGSHCSEDSQLKQQINITESSAQQPVCSENKLFQDSRINLKASLNVSKESCCIENVQVKHVVGIAIHTAPENQIFRDSCIGSKLKAEKFPCNENLKVKDVLSSGISQLLTQSENTTRANLNVGLNLFNDLTEHHQIQRESSVERIVPKVLSSSSSEDFESSCDRSVISPESNEMCVGEVQRSASREYAAIVSQDPGSDVLRSLNIHYAPNNYPLPCNYRNKNIGLTTLTSKSLPKHVSREYWNTVPGEDDERLNGNSKISQNLATDEEMTKTQSKSTFHKISVLGSALTNDKKSDFISNNCFIFNKSLDMHDSCLDSQYIYDQMSVVNSDPLNCQDPVSSFSSLTAHTAGSSAQPVSSAHLHPPNCQGPVGASASIFAQPVSSAHLHPSNCQGPVGADSSILTQPAGASAQPVSSAYSHPFNCLGPVGASLSIPAKPLSSVSTLFSMSAQPVGSSAQHMSSVPSVLPSFQATVSTISSIITQPIETSPQCNTLSHEHAQKEKQPCSTSLGLGKDAVASSTPDSRGIGVRRVRSYIRVGRHVVKDELMSLKEYWKYDGNFVCIICEKLWSDAIHLDSVKMQVVHHIHKHLGIKKYSCKECPKTFLKPRYLNQHTLHIHRKKQFPLSCEICGMGFNDEEAKLDHKNYHLGKRSYKCEECDRVFYTKLRLQIHSKVHSERAELCSGCNKTFYSLEHHKEFCKGNTTVVCDVCKAKFRSKKYLRNHFQSKHTDYRPHTCKQCGKSFALREILYRHLKMKHSKIEIKKKFKCTLCEKRYVSKIYLMSHIASHEGTRNFLCTICGKRFLYDCNLSTHMIFHGEKKIECTICGKKYFRNNMLQLHMKKVHGESKT